MNINSMIIHQYHGNTIPQRIEDGYVNITALCKANGKQFKHWHELKCTKAYLTALSASVGITTSKLIEVAQSGHQGTWGHKLVAIEIAKWISPAFAVWANTHLLELMETGKTELVVKPTEEITTTSLQDYIDLIVQSQQILKSNPKLAKAIFTEIATSI